ncbi:hypothetical protein LU631_08760 [Erwinia tracheiphila]|nr:hypothetical protein [Erwinia tracheiphila]UIA82437.1 hypothetical protein LU604_18110 [Erwinia tracheiphila]UIA89304.1 hypothetical protein LU631_08760 [Erwinia tracheiphila]UIA91026.1 hypothetical protein LU632_17655 [Erwinia tracheiphila]UIA97687.1 hypothetical protein LU633_07445 [Erwinia tracheiphila]
MTKAGRALQKHRDRQGNIFLKATGTPTVKNEQTQMIVDSILNDQNKTVTSKSAGRFAKVIDIVSKDGKGIRYSKDGKLIGFLETQENEKIKCPTGQLARQRKRCLRYI